MATFPLPSLAAALAACACAVATDKDSAHPALAGVSLAVAGDDLTVVGTNGIILAEWTVKADPSGTVDLPDGSTVVSVTAIKAALAVAKAKGAAVTLTKVGLEFKAGGAMATLTVIDSTYPDYKRALVLPGDEIAKPRRRYGVNAPNLALLPTMLGLPKGHPGVVMTIPDAGRGFMFHPLSDFPESRRALVMPITIPG